MTPTKTLPMTTDDFAVLMNRAFQSLQEWATKELDRQFEVRLADVVKKKDLEPVLKRLEVLEAGQGDITRHIVRMENDIEDIKLKVDGRAYRFDVADIDRRMVKVEEKLGIEPPPVRVPG